MEDVTKSPELEVVVLTDEKGNETFWHPEELERWKALADDISKSSTTLETARAFQSLHPVIQARIDELISAHIASITTSEYTSNKTKIETNE